MKAESMHLCVHLPSGIFLEEDGVTSIVAEATAGSFGLLPNRLDCVLPLVPGILVYTRAAAGVAGVREPGAAGATFYLAVDEGVLVKTGPEVHISVRHAVDGGDLGELRQTVEKEFLRLDEDER